MNWQNTRDTQIDGLSYDCSYCVCLNVYYRMENYEKGQVVEVEEPPVFALADSDVHMRVSGGSKIRNVMGFAMKKVKVLDESFSWRTIRK